MTGEMSVSQGIEIASKVHGQQRDKAGQAYINHPLRVMAKVGGDRARLVAALHDVIEDTDYRWLDSVFDPQIPLAPITEAERVEGWVAQLTERNCPREVIEAVLALTRGEKETPEAYYARVATNPLAVKVKYADIADNSDPQRLSLLDEATRERLSKKYAKARRLLAELGAPEASGRTV